MRGTMSTALVIAQKDLRTLFKSRRRIFLLYGFPVLMFLFLLFSSGISFTPTNLNGNLPEHEPTRVWVIDEAPSNYTQDLIEQWTDIPNTNITVYPTNKTIINDMLLDQDFQVIILIPQNYTSSLQAKETAIIILYYNQDDLEASNKVDEIKEKTRAYNTVLIEREYPGINLERVDQRVVPYSKNKGLPNFLATSFSILPMYLAFILVSPSLSIVILSIITEREQKTLEALLLQPIPRFGIFLGKLVYGLAIIILNILGYVALGIFAVSLFVFKASNQSSLGSSLGSGITGLYLPSKQLFLLYVFIGFTGFFLISLLLLSIAIFISFVSKDEREANLSFGLILTAPLFILPIFVGVATTGAPISIQLALSMLPLVGFIMGFFLMLTNAGITLPTVLSLLAQLYFTLVFLKASTMLSESDSLLEITWKKAGNYLFKSIILL